MIEVLVDRVRKFETILEKFPEVRYAGDPLLRQVAVEASVEEGIRIGKHLGEVLVRYRDEAGYGRGFAAPQIGESKAVFVTFVADQLQVFINPVIVEMSTETYYYRELCLSSGIVSVDIERPEWIVMEWTDVNGGKHRQKFEGFLARLYQHEVDHLRGELNLDKATRGSIELALFDPLQERLRKTRT